MAEDLYQNLLVELECAICTNYMAPPIRQCATGHSICDNCCKKLPKCPLCQAAFNDARNIALEALAKKIQYPCLYERSGCNERLSLDDRDAHEAVCLFRGYRCQMPKCTWVGRAEDVVSHWEAKKMSNKLYQEVAVCHHKLKTDKYFVNLVQAYDQLFWYKFKSTSNRLLWSIQYIGNPDDAGDYYFEIEIFKQGQPKARILLSEYCQEMNTDEIEMFKDGTCVSIPADIVMPFVGEDQVMIFYMRVFKCEEGTKANVERRPRKRYQKNHVKHQRRDNSKHGTKRGDNAAGKGPEKYGSHSTLYKTGGNSGGGHRHQNHHNKKHTSAKSADGSVLLN